MWFEKKKENEKSEHTGYAKTQRLTEKWKQTGTGKVEGLGEDSIRPLSRLHSSSLGDHILFQKCPFLYLNFPRPWAEENPPLGNN